MTEEKPTDQANPGGDKESHVRMDVPEEEDDDHVVVQTNAKADKKAKLNDYLSLFGFHDVVPERHHRGMSEDARGDGRGGPAAGKNLRKKKSQHQTVVYGDVDSDDDDDYNQDYGQQRIPDDADLVDDDSEEDDGEEEGEDEDDEAEEQDDEAMWEDDEQGMEIFDEEALEELEAAREYAEELERERIRELRMWEITRVKEILLERYLKTARIMITLRKKNIYLQDYLYHLAFRKGVLRGDPSVHGHHAGGLGADGDDTSVTGSQLNLIKLQKQRLQKKNSLMAARFARFLRKTGHLFDEEQAEDKAQQKHHHHPIVHHHGTTNPLRSVHNMRQRSQQYGKAKRFKDANACPDGKDCDKGKRKKASMMSTGNRYRKKRQSMRDIMDKHAKTFITNSAKNTDEALASFTDHRCKMKMTKKLLERAYLLQHQKETELPVLDQERAHLVHFVEQSVTAQNLAKRRALRRQKKNLISDSNKKTGPTNVNHQWIKSLERIRELRLKKAKLEQDHRLVLIEKVHQWDTWEKRDMAALESVSEFILEMVSKTSLSKRESEGFNAGMEQFRKQLYTLFEAMLWQVTRLCKAKGMLQMAQRKLKDKASVATESVKGFSLGDFERMAIENREGHQKLAERKVHLVKQSQKLQRYISKVATGNTDEKILWGVLHAGRHELKQLWQLCQMERDNLMKKWKDALKSKRIHRRMFMQVAVVENQRVFTDYLRVRNRVHELEEKRRILNTRYRQNNAVLRILKIRTNEISNTITGCRQGKMDQITGDEQKFFKNTIEYRLNPRPPNTIHSVNTRRNSSLHRILEPEIDQKIFRPIRSHPSRENKKKGRNET